ncbi:MAG TPA: hypothetical protein VJB37_02670 [Patescibacteria group bacterium]|nr:hypothetical protein [Patescibacteria group bacterium]
MKRNNAVLIISAIILLLMIAGGTYWYQMSFQDKNNTINIEPSKTKQTENEPIEFINNLLGNLPDTYLTSEVEYFESLDDAEPQKAIEVKPCDDKNLDPVYSPLCSTSLTIVEQEKTNNLDEYIKTNKTLSWYESAYTKLAQTTYKEHDQLAYTPQVFMCPGTGGDGCLRKIFIYHLDDGRNIMAEIHFWSYENGTAVATPIKDVQTIIALYEDLLTK